MSNDQQLSTESTENKFAALDDDNTAAEDIKEDVDLLKIDGEESADAEEVEESTEEETTEETPEEDIEDIDPNDIELQVPVKMKELLAKYPNIKKEFPELIAANFREKEYAEVFPTVEDAKEAVEKVQTLDKFQDLLFSGDSAPILDIVKKEDPAGFDKLVNNYLPNLQKVDPNAYTYIVKDTISKYLNLAFSVGKNRNDQDLQTAAQMLYNLEFGGGAVPPTYGNPKKNDPEIDDVKKERAAFENEKHGSKVTDLNTRTSNSIKHAISINIDPKNNMTGYVKKNAINDCYALIDQQMKEDKRFTATVNGLWEKAKKNSYSESSVNEIRKLVLGRAKYLMKEAITKTRNEALKGISTREKTESAPRKIKVKDTTPTDSGKNAGVLNRKGKTTFELLSEA